MDRTLVARLCILARDLISMASIFCLLACGRTPEIGGNGEILQPKLPSLLLGVNCTYKILSLDNALERSRG